MSAQNIVQSEDLADAAQARTVAPAAENRRQEAAHDDHDHDDHEHDHGVEWPEALRIGLVAVAAVAVSLRVWEPFQAVGIIGVIGLLGAPGRS